MKRFVWIGAFILVAAIAHMASLRAAPYMIMSKVIRTMADRGMPLHRFIISSRITPQTQTIVRPSPDLAYSICRFDLANGPIIIKGTMWAGYASLTIFDAQTNAVFIGSLDSENPDENSSQNSVILTMGSDVKAAKNIPIVMLKKPTGLALIRRIAPTTALYEQAQLLTKSDVCAPYSASQQ
ncbi:MAG: DUF1254 domain-containing protein [Robiginitomaculum sp.]|nr:DUF1254 domain-containing protein [Robiginitomaculum sp.]